MPKKWPKIGAAETTKRATPWNYIMNVCTHSYSLVWYGWKEWEDFIDWQALWGINLNLAMTGQEEVQYKVFLQLGLNDTEIRAWFNGPAFLTWWVAICIESRPVGFSVRVSCPRSWFVTTAVHTLPAFGIPSWISHRGMSPERMGSTCMRVRARARVHTAMTSNVAWGRPALQLPGHLCAESLAA